MENFGRYNLCCNLRQLEDHRVKNGLRRASITHQITHNLSTSCRKAHDLQNTASNSVPKVDDNFEEELEDARTKSTFSSISTILSGPVLPVVYDAFALLNQSPIIKKHVDNQTYLESKVKKVYNGLNTTVGVIKPSDDETNSQNFLELLEKLKTKFNDSNTQRSEKSKFLLFCLKRGAYLEYAKQCVVPYT
ncbi:unnamed protein product [Psylliodes chrysocephalus]|uniref:Uncharacterized protein n=1 Tax=Psylliodes chrysocephalus TaxID=3402493 RepID=A0A9P0CP17_9CUCU|nr:unnamed protein product [Psylliodes chrysocephala]